jgi:uncharacterized protein YceK
MKIILFLALLVSGCATVFTGTSDEITFTSEPIGAAVFVDREQIGITPVTKKIDRELHDSVITYKLENYNDSSQPLIRSFNKWSIANITIWPGWLIDALTGAINKAQYTTYHSDLSPISSAEILKE